METIVPENLNRIEVIAYMIGMQQFKICCKNMAESTFPFDGSERSIIQAHDLAEEMFKSFADLADQRIRFAMDNLAIHGGYATAKNFQEAAHISVITMSHMMNLESLLGMKEDELING